MSLTQGSYISYDDFNKLRDRVIKEIQRRSKKTNDNPYGNDYNNNTFTLIPNIDNQNLYDFFYANYLNKLLDFFQNFKTFPDNLNQIYADGSVNKTDIIFALNLLLTIINNLELENRQKNDDCNIGCMGLCTNTCNNKCTDACTSCSGTCSGTCTGTCKGDCYTSCSNTCSGGCSGCSDSCLESAGGCQACGSDGCTSYSCEAYCAGSEAFDT